MKKILALILLAFLTAGLFIACNGDAAETVFSGTDSSTLENLFFFKSIAANSSVTLNKTDNPTPIDFIYSTDGEEWKDYTIGQAISLPNIGDTVYFRAKKESGGAFNLNHIPNRAKIVDKNFYSFASEGQVSVSGNIMYLVDPKGKATTMAESAFSLLFKNNSGLVSAEDLILPALQLSDYCYSEMFSGCSSLTKVPKLPATKLKPYCYNYMFYNCSSLENAPELPAMELAEDCYFSMFASCKALKQAPELRAETLKNSCYTGMFSKCDKLEVAPKLPAETLDSFCYQAMFSGCTSLKNAPALPATELKSYCYYQMFNGCSALETAPYLPAQELVTECYYSMFADCTSLKKIEVAFTDWKSSESCTLNWISGVPNNGLTFICPSTLDTSAYSGLGWNITKK